MHAFNYIKKIIYNYRDMISVFFENTAGLWFLLPYTNLKFPSPFSFSSPKPTSLFRIPHTIISAEPSHHPNFQYPPLIYFKYIFELKILFSNSRGATYTGKTKAWNKRRLRSPTNRIPLSKPRRGLFTCAAGAKESSISSARGELVLGLRNPRLSCGLVSCIRDVLHTRWLREYNEGPYSGTR